jgi:hypothetical protein
MPSIDEGGGVYAKVKKQEGVDCCQHRIHRFQCGVDEEHRTQEGTDGNQDCQRQKETAPDEFHRPVLTVDNIPCLHRTDDKILCSVIKKPEVHDLFLFANGKIKQNSDTLTTLWLSLISDGQADA